MDSVAADQTGTAPLAALLGAVDSVQTPADVMRVLARLHQRGIFAGFFPTPEIDPKASGRVIGQLYQGGLGLPDRDYYTKSGAASDSLRQAYVAHVGRMLALAGWSAADADSAAQRVLRLDTGLATGRSSASTTAGCCWAPTRTPGQPARVDYEYVRQGTACCLIAFAPHDGWRHVTVAAHRTNTNFAHAMRHLADASYPDATCIRVVLDNLSTHTAAALYQTFGPAEARRLAAKLEFHYTPKYASWLNMAELELAVLARQCLDRRLPTLGAVSSEVAVWE